MALKDMFKNFMNVDDTDFEDDVYESAESVAEQPRAKKESPLMKVGFERRNRSADGSAMKVVIVRPDVFDDVAAIADHLIAGKTVVLNLETANRDMSRRMVDFMSGAAYALSCKLKKVANNTFIIVPEYADIAGELILDDFDEQNYYL